MTHFMLCSAIFFSTAVYADAHLPAGLDNKAPSKGKRCAYSRSTHFLSQE